MSKIGRKSIPLGGAQAEVQGAEVHYKGKFNSGVYQVPKGLKAEVRDKKLFLVADDAITSELKELWGLHRALLANTIMGADKKFEKELKIEGLGFKVAVAGNKLQWSLGFSHKIDYQLPEGVTAEVDKTGQQLMVRSIDKEVLGLVCSQLRDLRCPEPYKGKGIRYATEEVRRKVGKAK